MKRNTFHQIPTNYSNNGTWSTYQQLSTTDNSQQVPQLPSMRDILGHHHIYETQPTFDWIFERKEMSTTNQPFNMKCNHKNKFPNFETCYSAVEKDQHQQSNVNIDQEISQLHEQINQMEKILESQAQTIVKLKCENEKKKRKITTHNMKNSLQKTCIFHPLENMHEQPKTKKLKSSTLQVSSLDDEIIRGKLEDFTVIWQGKQYVLVDIFKNKNKVVNYYIPLYQSQFPDRVCKLVLSSDEYKQLFKENSHRCESERKHAWRISIFTVDFYEFVNNQL